MSEKKTGANKSDQKAIGNLFDAGYTADQISKQLFIKKEVVGRFQPEKQKKAKKKVAETDKKSQEDHAKVMAKKTGAEEIQGKPSEG